VAVRLHGQFGIEITPEVLLDRPTIAELAVYLGGPGANGEVAIPAVSEKAARV
jgi:hypothetical protein